MSEQVLIALGGNALGGRDEPAALEQQLVTVAESAQAIAELVSEGYEVVLTHGNGPQVGRFLNTEPDTDSPISLFECGAATQGTLGACLFLALERALSETEVSARPVPMLTPVHVDGDSDAFQNPTKPVGEFCTEAEAETLRAETDVELRHYEDRGWRRVVPSPEPKRVANIDRISDVLQSGDVPICGGGGGLPVTENEAGQTVPVDAVIDKDLTAAQLGVELAVDQLVILTDINHVKLHYGSSDETALETVGCATARRYLDRGEFERGSMYEKVQAAIRFLESGVGDCAAITSLDQCSGAVKGSEGTQFHVNR